VFERFTHEARRVVERAQDEARELHHDWVGTEHLLLGLFGRGTPASRALDDLALRLGHRHIGPEHVLLGLLRTEEGLAAEILARRSGSLAGVRSALLHELRRPA
jgi:ATP-dependent Clp protease ATP-binding subunit ClpC